MFKTASNRPFFSNSMFITESPRPTMNISESLALLLDISLFEYAIQLPQEFGPVPGAHVALHNQANPECRFYNESVRRQPFHRTRIKKSHRSKEAASSRTMATHPVRGPSIGPVTRRIHLVDTSAPRSSTKRARSQRHRSRVRYTARRAPAKLRDCDLFAGRLLFFDSSL